VATWDDVRRLALALPETTEGSRWGTTTWNVKDGRKDRGFVWERPLRKADLAALGSAAPDGPILAARLEHEGHKHALIAEDPAVFFTTPHFDGYPAVLVRLERISASALEELIEDAWLACAPKRLAQSYLNARAIDS
jgi:hypothetical protein